MGDGVDYGQEEAYESSSLELEMDIEEMCRLYKAAREAKTGSTVLCPTCKKAHRKTTYHKVFDSTRCKDRYWNLTDEGRRERARNYS